MNIKVGSLVNGTKGTWGVVESIWKPDPVDYPEMCSVFWLGNNDDPIVRKDSLSLMTKPTDSDVFVYQIIDKLHQELATSCLCALLLEHLTNTSSELVNNLAKAIPNYMLTNLDTMVNNLKQDLDTNFYQIKGLGK